MSMYDALLRKRQAEKAAPGQNLETLDEWQRAALRAVDKIQATTRQGEELAALVIAVANAFDCSPEERSLLLDLAGRDPIGMRGSFEIMAHERGLKVTA